MILTIALGIVLGVVLLGIGYAALVIFFKFTTLVFEVIDDNRTSKAKKAQEERNRRELAEVIRQYRINPKSVPGYYAKRTFDLCYGQHEACLGCLEYYVKNYVDVNDVSSSESMTGAVSVTPELNGQWIDTGVDQGQGFPPGTWKWLEKPTS